jgi:hypothetical protein
MIKNITLGQGININGGHISWPSFYNTPSGNSLVGQKHPTVVNALASVANAEEQVKIVAALVDTE